MGLPAVGGCAQGSVTWKDCQSWASWETGGSSRNAEQVVHRKMVTWLHSSLINPGGIGGLRVPSSRRDSLRIARRFNAGKHPACHTSPEGTTERSGVGLDLNRPFGTRDLLASNPALKRWAILACPFGTAKLRSPGNPKDECRRTKEARISKSKAARHDILVFHLIFGFRYSLDMYLAWGAHATRVQCSAPSPNTGSGRRGADRCSRGGCAPPR